MFKKKANNTGDLKLIEKFKTNRKHLKTGKYNLAS